MYERGDTEFHPSPLEWKKHKTYGLWVLSGLLSCIWAVTNSDSLAWGTPLDIAETVVTLGALAFAFGGLVLLTLFVGIMLLEAFSSWMGT